MRIAQDSYRYSISEATILAGGLLVVARLTQGLPVLGVPEQILVATVWCDVIDHSCRRDAPLSFALSAERMARQPGRARLPPAAVVTATGCGPAPLVSLLPNLLEMLLTVARLRQERRAAGMPARDARTNCHDLLLHQTNVTARDKQEPHGCGRSPLVLGNVGDCARYSYRHWERAGGRRVSVEFGAPCERQ